MRVLDACVVTDALAAAGPDGDRARVLLSQQGWLHAPAMLGAEVTNALRGLVRRGMLSAGAARAAAVSTGEMRAAWYPFQPFVERTWELRENLTTYDAWYVALAESLDFPLVTSDQRLRRASGPRCPVLSPEEALG